MDLRSFLQGSWRDTRPESVQPVLHPTTDAVLGYVGAPKHALGQAMAWGRVTGGAAVRSIVWSERSAALGGLADHLRRHRDELLSLSMMCGGNTRADAKFDVDGAIGVLNAYARWSSGYRDDPWAGLEAPQDPLPGRPLQLQHVLVPRRGLAVHIQAFNFPAWGLIQKFAAAWLGGMPVLSKPAVDGSPLAVRIAELLLTSGLFPTGSFQLLLGTGKDVFEHLDHQDVVAFTGSAATARLLRTHPRLLACGARLNIEADSVNAAIIGADVECDSPLFTRAMDDAVLEMTQKAGQKCTAIRRLLIPARHAGHVHSALVERLASIGAATGDPHHPDVKMGPLASRVHRERVRTGVARIERRAARIFGDPFRSDFLGVPSDAGACFEPILFAAASGDVLDPHAPFHREEVFGPVLTVMPYDGSAEHAAAIVGFGEGGLVGALYSDDPGTRRIVGLAVAPSVGRLVLVDSRSLPARLSPGAVLPEGKHGGPGRAGDGAELGRAIGWQLYRQRVTLQGSPGTLLELSGSAEGFEGAAPESPV